MSQQDVLSAKPRQAGLFFIAVTVCLDVVSHTIVFPVLPRLVEQLLDGDRPGAARWVGVLFAGWSLAQFFAAPILGMLSDRFGRRPIILISVFGLSIDLVVTALAPNLAWLMVARVICGLTAGAQTAAMAYVADITPPAERTQRYGLLNAAAWTGVIIGPAIGGVLGAIDPRAPFWAAAAVALANGIYGLAVLPESLPLERRAPLNWGQANPWASLTLLRERTGLLTLGVVFFMLWFAGQAINSVFVLYTAYRYHWTPMALGIFCSVLAVGNILVQTQLASRAAKRLGERTAVLAGLAFQVAGFTAVGLASTGLLFWLANIPMILANIAGPALQALMTSKVHPDEQGRLQGAMGSIGSMTGLFGPIAFTQLFAWAISLGHGPGWSGVTILAGAGFSAVAWALVMISRHQDRQGLSIN